MVLKVANGGLQNGPSAFQGSWDANANSPFLQRGVGFSGEYYIVSVAGNTTLDGNTNWKVGDWAIFNGATNQWEKISGGAGTNGIQIVTDTTSNTSYNITLTSASSGNITTEYVDPSDLSFNPSTKTLKATNANVTGNLTASNATITNLTATNGNITNFSSSNATITGGSISNTTLSNVTGGSINISNDTSNNTNYNVLMTTSSGGNVSTEYVDSPIFTFNPSIGMGVLGSGSLTVPSIYAHGYISLGDPGSTKPAALEAYTSGTLAFYTGSVENVVISPTGYLGIGIEGTNYNTYAPLYVTNVSGPQVMINANNLANHGLEITYDSSNNAIINNYNPANLDLNTNNQVSLRIDYQGNITQYIPDNGEIYHYFKKRSNGVEIASIDVYEATVIGGPSNGAYVEFNLNNGTTAQANYLSMNWNGAFGFNQQWGTTGQVFISQGTAAHPIWTSTLANLTLSNVTITSGSISNVAIGAAITTKNTAYTATANDETILANVSAGAFAITLPTAVGATGKTYCIKKIDSSANAVTVNTTSSQTIDGATSRLLTNQYDAIQVQSDGAHWFIIANTFGRNGTAGTF